MRLQAQLTVLLVTVGTVPVAVSGLSSAYLAQEQLEAAARLQLGSVARAVSEVVDGHVRRALTDLRLASGSVDLGTLSEAELAGALTLVFRQVEGASVVTLVSADGEGLGAPVYQSEVSTEAALRSRLVVDEAGMEAFSRNIPLAAALKAGAALGAPYVPAPGGVPRLAMAVAVSLGAEKRGVVALELSLGALQDRAREAARDLGGAVTLVDNAGKAFVEEQGAGGTAGPPSRIPPEAWAVPVLPGEPVRVNVVPVAGESHLVALARPDRIPWSVVVAQARAAALEPATRMQQQTLFWTIIALACALLSGVILARGVGGPVAELVRAARAFQEGRLDVRVPRLPVEELARVGEAFNQAAEEVRRRDDELRAFNADLQKRVEERTRDLKEAQDQLINAQKMAAVGELGAGVAHEINNPLAGLLGTVQLILLRGQADGPLQQQLKDVEKEALRIRDIVQNLLALTPQKGGTESVVDVNKMVESALGLVARSIVESRIEVKKELDPALPRVRGRASDLQQALLALVANARHAMPDGGVLRVATQSIDGKLVRITVADTGRGIAPDIKDRIFEPFFTTRAHAGAKGLGLALVHRVATDMGGRVIVESEPGKGAAFSLTVAAARDKVHLA